MSMGRSFMGAVKMSHWIKSNFKEIIEAAIPVKTIQCFFFLIIDTEQNFAQSKFESRVWCAAVILSNFMIIFS